MADSALAEGHNLGTQKNMDPWGRAGQGKGSEAASSRVFSPVQWVRSASRTGAQDMVQTYRALLPELCSHSSWGSLGSKQYPPPPSQGWGHCTPSSSHYHPKLSWVCGIS